MRSTVFSNKRSALIISRSLGHVYSIFHNAHKSLLLRQKADDHSQIPSYSKKVLILYESRKGPMALSLNKLYKN